MSDTSTPNGPSETGAHAGVTREEIGQLLSDSGYSGNNRNDRLNEALTELSQTAGENPDAETSALIAEIREALRTSQSTEAETSNDNIKDQGGS